MDNDIKRLARALFVAAAWLLYARLVRMECVIYDIQLYGARKGIQTPLPDWTTNTLPYTDEQLRDFNACQDATWDWAHK
jgi:hypothetical protein